MMLGSWLGRVGLGHVSSRQALHIGHERVDFVVGHRRDHHAGRGAFVNLLHGLLHRFDEIGFIEVHSDERPADAVMHLERLAPKLVEETRRMQRLAWRGRDSGIGLVAGGTEFFSEEPLPPSDRGVRTAGRGLLRRCWGYPRFYFAMESGQPKDLAGGPSSPNTVHL